MIVYSLNQQFIQYKTREFQLSEYFILNTKNENEKRKAYQKIENFIGLIMFNLTHADFKHKKYQIILIKKYNHLNLYEGLQNRLPVHETKPINGSFTTTIIY